MKNFIKQIPVKLVLVAVLLVLYVMFFIELFCCLLVYMATGKDVTDNAAGVLKKVMDEVVQPFEQDKKAIAADNKQ